jgi:ribonucleotide monophosphatase NagD (HAD superfamily)
MTTDAANNNEKSNKKQHNETFEVHECFSKDLIDRYDGFILDQFGVLHNGVDGLEGAPDLVRKLANADEFHKKLVILSNSSSSSASCKAKLPVLGFDSKDFVNAVTSGEEAGRHIRDEYATEAATATSNNEGGSSDEKKKTKKALWFTWKTLKTLSPLRFLELCGNIPVTVDPNEADYVILHGADLLRGPGEDGTATEISLGDFHTSGTMDENENSEGGSTIESVLKICADRGLPMVCANPDFIMIKPDGSTGHMPGTIAKRYEELGGSCLSFGKPHVSHFEACLRDLGLPRHKVVHVGDSLHHDVKGANECGIDSVFVAGGVHRTELGSELNDVPSEDALYQLFEKHGQMPTHVVPMFRMQ